MFTVSECPIFIDGVFHFMRKVSPLVLYFIILLSQLTLIIKI